MTRDEILLLLRAKLGEVLGTDPAGIADGARFAEDLHADSLDLVEVVESVEGRLRERGVDLRLGEDELVLLRTVGEAADRLHAAAGGPAGGASR